MGGSKCVGGCVGLTLVMPCALSEPRSISLLLLTLSLPCYAHSSIAGRLRATVAVMNGNVDDGDETI
jgi:hypothetical protein